MTDLKVDVEAMKTTADEAGGLVDAVGDLQRATSEAEVPEISWGLLGLATTYTAYRMMLDDFKDHLNQMAEGFQSIREKLSQAAETYDSIEQDVGNVMVELESALGSVTPPDNRALA